MKKFLWKLPLVLGLAATLFCGCKIHVEEGHHGVEATTATVKAAMNADGSEYTVEEWASHYYETFSAKAHYNLTEPRANIAYETPNESCEVKKGVNGATNAGTLTVVSPGLSYRGYFNPADSFDYSSFGIMTNVSLKFKFYAPTTCSKESYLIDNVGTTYAIDGFPTAAPIGKGTVIVLKRLRGSSSWTKVADFTDQGTGMPAIEYKPLPSDIVAGCYYRFLSAYQYSYLDKVDSYLWGLLNDRYYAVANTLQRTTVFLGLSNTSVRFLADSTPKQSHEMPVRYHEAALESSDPLLIDESAPITRYPSPNLGLVGAPAKFWFIGEAIKGGEENSDYATGMPVYFYNGVESKVTLRFSLANAYTAAQRYVITDTTSSKLVTHTLSGQNNESEISRHVGAALCLVQGYDEEGWQNLVSANPDKTTYDLDLPIGYVGYELYRFVFLFEAKKNNLTTLCACTSYFKLSVDTTRFRARYSVDELTDAEISAYARATTLMDGAVVFSSFSVSLEDLAAIDYAYNDSDYQAIDTSEVKRTFSASGKYCFRVYNSFGETQQTTIYVLGDQELKEDNAKELFFPRYHGLLDDSYRCFVSSSNVPCYKVGAPFYLHASPYLPDVRGSIKRINSDGEATIMQRFENLHSPLMGSFPDAGRYVVDVTVGSSDAGGDTIRFTIRFQIVEAEEGLPTVNYDLLHSGFSAASYIPKVYVVDYPSLGQGKYRFLFPYDETGAIEAVEFAADVEAEKLIHNDEGTYEYEGETYSSRFALYAVIKKNAEKLVREEFLDHSLYTEEGAYELGDIRQTKLDKDKYVTSSASIAKRLCSDPIYLNGFQFKQLRQFESASVYAIHLASGKRYDIPYDVDVSEILDQTGAYRIYETNHCGTREYDAVFAYDGEIPVSTRLRYYDDEGQIKAVDDVYVKGQEQATYSGNAFYFASIVDEIDPFDVVLLSLPNGSIEQYLASELVGQIVDGSGEYEVMIYNRLGNSHSFFLRISGNKREFSPHRDPSNPLSYTHVEVA